MTLEPTGNFIERVSPAVVYKVGSDHWTCCECVMASYMHLPLLEIKSTIIAACDGDGTIAPVKGSLEKTSDSRVADVKMCGETEWETVKP